MGLVGKKTQAQEKVVQTPVASVPQSDAEKLIAMGYTDAEATAMVGSLRQSRKEGERDAIIALAKGGKTLGEVLSLYPSLASWTVKEVSEIAPKPRKNAGKGNGSVPATRRPRASKEEKEARIVQVIEGLKGGSVTMADLKSALGDWVGPIVGKLVKDGVVQRSGETKRNSAYSFVS